MPRRTNESRSHRSHQTRRTNPFANFLSRPVVQIGLVVIAVIAIALIAIIGSAQPTSTAFAAEINSTQAHDIYTKGSAFFVDVREQSEWDSFHIPNTTLIPLGELPNRLNEVPKDKPIVVVCRSGNRSQEGRDILLKAGYTNVTSMSGGVTDWKAQGFPIQP
jgi:rhodanese-related sulfurtransferase